MIDLGVVKHALNEEEGRQAIRYWSYIPIETLWYGGFHGRQE